MMLTMMMLTMMMIIVMMMIINIMMMMMLMMMMTRTMMMMIMNYDDDDDDDADDPIKLFQTRGKWWELIVLVLHMLRCICTAVPGQDTKFTKVHYITLHMRSTCTIMHLHSDLHVKKHSIFFSFTCTSPLGVNHAGKVIFFRPDRQDFGAE